MRSRINAGMSAIQKHIISVARIEYDQKKESIELDYATEQLTQRQPVTSIQKVDDTLPRTTSTATEGMSSSSSTSL